MTAHRLPPVQNLTPGKIFEPNYWLDLFTGETWDQFRKAGAGISGFRKRMDAYSRGVKRGDVFICYLTGLMRWVGALEVTGRTNDTTPIWGIDDFPVRFSVKPLILLEPQLGMRATQRTVYTSPTRTIIQATTSRRCGLCSR